MDTRNKNRHVPSTTYGSEKKADGLGIRLHEKKSGTSENAIR